MHVQINCNQSKTIKYMQVNTTQQSISQLKQNQSAYAHSNYTQPTQNINKQQNQINLNNSQYKLNTVKKTYKHHLNNKHKTTNPNQTRLKQKIKRTISQSKQQTKNNHRSQLKLTTHHKHFNINV